MQGDGMESRMPQSHGGSGQASKLRGPHADLPVLPPPPVGSKALG